MLLKLTKRALVKLVVPPLIFVMVFSGWFYVLNSLNILPKAERVQAVACGFGSDIGGGVCRGFLTTTGSNQVWTSPSDWNNNNNTIEVVGAGGSGGVSARGNTFVSGGGGGAYSKIVNLTVDSPGNTVFTYFIGSGGSSVSQTNGSLSGNHGGDTWFGGSTFGASGVAAKGGNGGITGTSATINGGTGGQSSAGIGSVKTSGGNGGNVGHSGSATGGGGAGGTTANGTAGTNTSGTNSATSGGIGGTENGGAGGNGATSGTSSGSGEAGTAWVTFGVGGGGGGMRRAVNGAISAGHGGLYGAGGGGCYNPGGGNNSSTACTSGAGADGLIVITYTPLNTPPTLSISEPNGVDDQVIAGTSYDIVYILSDADDVVTAAFYYDTDNSGLDGVAIEGECGTAPEGSGVACAWNTAGVTPGSYYVYGIANDGTNSAVSAYSPGQLTITAAEVSISLSTDGVVQFGTVPKSTSRDSTASGVGDPETIQVDSGPADLEIRSTDFTDGSNTWNLGLNSGNETVKWEFSKDGTNWTVFQAVDSLYPIESGVSSGNTRNIYFKITTPSDTNSYQQHSATVTIVASSP